MNHYECSQVRAERSGFALTVEHCRLQAGAIYAVTGPNGSGKTTFLDLLFFTLKPIRGKVFFNGEPAAGFGPERLRAARRKIGYLMQNPYLFKMSVADNIGCGLKARGRPAAETRRRAGQTASTLSIAHLAGKFPWELSGGEAQKVTLARTLVMESDVLLLDEPTTHMDRESMRTTETLLQALNREQHTTIVIATHSPEQAYRLGAQVLTITDGRLVAAGRVNVLRGVLALEPDGTRVVAVEHSLSIPVTHGAAGPVTLAIDPQDIILSTERIASSALNNFPGTIEATETVGGSLLVQVNAGATFHAAITPRSFQALGLSTGGRVWVTFKAHSVKVVEP